MSGTEAEVDFETNKDASLVVGIYDEAGIKMVASGHAEVTTDEKTVKINIEDGQLQTIIMSKASWLIRKHMNLIVRLMRPRIIPERCRNFSQRQQKTLRGTRY